MPVAGVLLAAGAILYHLGQPAYGTALMLTGGAIVVVKLPERL